MVRDQWRWKNTPLELQQPASTQGMCRSKLWQGQPNTILLFTPQIKGALGPLESTTAVAPNSASPPTTLPTTLRTNTSKASTCRCGPLASLACK
jgi:hypothetical protein